MGKCSGRKLLYFAVFFIALGLGFIYVIPVTAQEGAVHTRVVDTRFLINSGVLAGSSAFDVETTFRALKNPNAREGNPIMKPLVELGRPATYSFVGAMDAGSIYFSYRMKKSNSPGLRKLWWIGPVTASTAHCLVGGLNLRIR
jgi:hypothetical protein